MATRRGAGAGAGLVVLEAARRGVWARLVEARADLFFGRGRARAGVRRGMVGPVGFRGAVKNVLESADWRTPTADSTPSCL